MILVTDKLLARFNAKVDKSGECWLWTASTHPVYKYGRLKLPSSRQNIYAHRLSFYFANGYLPDEVGHTCNVHNCVKPNHLIDTTHQQNIIEQCNNGTNPIIARNTRAHIRRLSNATI